MLARVPDPDRRPDPEVPEGMRSDARETWPSAELIESWLGDSAYDFELRPGEDIAVSRDDPEAMAAVNAVSEGLSDRLSEP